MIPKFGTEAAVIGLLAVAVAAASGCAYHEHRKRELREVPVALARDTSFHLREAPSIEAGSTAADRL
jgi:hypothetical protein